MKLRIDEIADRYIKPDEGTFDFAMMYVPAENVFYEIITAEPGAESPWELFQYAWGRRVIPVSPNSFYSYLMAIAYGLRGMRIEQRARTIVGELRSVQEAFGAWTGDFAQLGRHLKNAGAKFDECQRKVDQFGDRVARIAGAEGPTDAADPETPAGCRERRPAERARRLHPIFTRDPSLSPPPGPILVSVRTTGGAR